jgi:hypothetical protein
MTPIVMAWDVRDTWMIYNNYGTTTYTVWKVDDNGNRIRSPDSSQDNLYQLYLSGYGFANYKLKKNGQLDVTSQLDGLQQFTKQTTDTANRAVRLQKSIMLMAYGRSCGSSPYNIPCRALKTLADKIIDATLKQLK